MSRIRGNTLTPEAQRELDAVDDALAGTPVGAEHDSLARLVREVREVRPVADEQFIAELDARAAEGFVRGQSRQAPEEGGIRSRLRERRRAPGVPFKPRVLTARPALGLALVSLLAVSVALPLALQGGQGGINQRAPAAQIENSPPPPPAQQGAAGQAAPAAAPHAPSEAAEAASRGGFKEQAAKGKPFSQQRTAAPQAGTPAASARQVEQTATLDVGVAPSAIDSKSHQVFTLVTSYGGYVRTSNVSSGGGQGGASFDIRVPSSNLSHAINALSALGHVRSENNTTNDVTEQFGSLHSALAGLRARRASVLKRLSSASSSEQEAALKAQLHRLEDLIGRYEGSLRALTNRIDYTPLELTLTPEAPPASTHGGELTPGSAAHDAARILEAALAVLVIAAAALLPLGAIALAAWMIFAAGRRRLREQTLDAS